MKKILSFLLVTVCAHAAYPPWPPCSEVDEKLMLEAISYAEDSWDHVGLAGERSPWQILPSTWRLHTSLPFDTATRDQQRWVATKILRHYSFVLEMRGVYPTPYRIALCWNGGINAKHYSRSTVDYANRVNNLYHR